MFCLRCPQAGYRWHPDRPWARSLYQKGQEQGGKTSSPGEEVKLSLLTHPPFRVTCCCLVCAPPPPLGVGAAHSSCHSCILVFLILSVYHAIYLEEMAASEVTRKLASAFSVPLHQINQVYRQGPTGIHILLNDQVRQVAWPGGASGWPSIDHRTGVIPRPGLTLRGDWLLPFSLNYTPCPTSSVTKR